MKPRRGMFVCGTLHREVVAALVEEGLSDVEIVGFQCECGQQAGSTKAFEHAWLARADEFTQLLVLGEPCVPAAQLQAMAAGRANVHFMASGFELFLPKVLVQQYQRAGAYLLTPGWLANWPERMKRWGFDQATAEAFFAESCARLTLLDTGTDARSSTQLTAFAAFVNCPSETVPVGLEVLRLRLAQNWRGWPPQTPSAPASAPAGMQSPADYQMIFDVLRRLVGFTSETDLARGFFELFEMVCAPGGLAYLPFRDGKAGEMIVSPSATITSAEWVERLSGSRSDCTWLAERDGFVVRLQRNREMLGALLVDRVALPLRKADYLNLTQTILPVLALAIANARNLERMTHSQAVLRDSEARYRAVFEGAAEGILVAEIETRKFDYANPAICTLLGYTLEELTGMDVQRIHPVESLPAVFAAFEAQSRCELQLAVELPCLRKNGEILYVNINTARVEIDGRPSLVGFFSDITEGKRHEAERRELEKNVHEKQKLAAVGTLACGMGHEINNPIMGIINYAQLIKDRLQGKDEALEDFAGEIMIEAERIAGLVRSLSAFAARDIATRAAAPVSDLIESAISATRATLTRDHITLAVEVPADLPAVSCDRRQIEQVLTGLLANARDALNEKYPGHDENKKIIITALPIAGKQEGIHDPQSQIVNRKSAIRVTVEDHGAGIPDAVRMHIFEPFFTTKDKSVGAGSIGKGLGLFVSYATVQEHGGVLSVESEVGQWTRVHVDLPALPTEVKS